MPTKTSLVSVNENIEVLIVNNYKCFAFIKNYHTIDKDMLNHIKSRIEDKLETVIKMVKYDELLDVIEFYPIIHQSPLL